MRLRSRVPILSGESVGEGWRGIGIAVVLSFLAHTTLVQAWPTSVSAGSRSTPAADIVVTLESPMPIPPVTHKSTPAQPRPVTRTPEQKVTPRSIRHLSIARTHSSSPEDKRPQHPQPRGTGSGGAIRAGHPAGAVTGRPHTTTTAARVLPAPVTSAPDQEASQADPLSDTEGQEGLEATPSGLPDGGTATGGSGGTGGQGTGTGSGTQGKGGASPDLPRPPAPTVGRITPPSEVLPLPPKAIPSPPVPVEEPQTLQEAQYRDNPPPAYPREARRLRKEGIVRLRVAVNAEGGVDSVEVAVSSGTKILDDAASAAVARWKFEPGRRGNTPVTSYVTVPIRFQIR